MKILEGTDNTELWFVTNCQSKSKSTAHWLFLTRCLTKTRCHISYSTEYWNTHSKECSLYYYNYCFSKNEIILIHRSTLPGSFVQSSQCQRQVYFFPHQSCTTNFIMDINWAFTQLTVPEVLFAALWPSSQIFKSKLHLVKLPGQFYRHWKCSERPFTTQKVPTSVATATS
jgi:hypothetical protein